MEFHGGSTDPLEPLVEAETLVVDPPEASLPGLLTRIEGTAPTAPVRMLLSSDVAEAVSAAFLLESRVAAAVARDHLRVRETTSRCDDRVVLADERAAALVSVDQQVGVLPTDADPVVEALRETYEPAWAAGEPFSTRAPPRDRLLERGTEPLPDAFTAELERAIDGASSLEWQGTPTPVELAVAVAARAGAHHYDLCEWAEAAGFTSRSTVARTKQRLEEAGLIDVEPVPQERGRPRQQLVVDDERLAAADAEALATTLRRLTT